MSRPIKKRNFGDPTTTGPQLILEADIGAGAESCWVNSQKGTSTFDVSSIAGGATPDRTGRVRLQEAAITGEGQAILDVLPFGGPVGVAATASLTYKLDTFFTGPVSIVFPGTGYTVGDTVTPLGGTSTTSAVLTVAATTGGPGTGIAALTITTPGDYSVPSPSDGTVPGLFTDLSTLTGGGSGAEVISLEWDILAVTVTGGGSGYTAPPPVLACGLLVPGTYLSALTADAVTSIAVTGPGFFFRGATAGPPLPTLVVASPGVLAEKTRMMNQHQLKTFEGNTYVWRLGVAAPTDGVEVDVPFG